MARGNNAPSSGSGAQLRSARPNVTAPPTSETPARPGPRPVAGPPSAVARRVAAALWPDVQRQEKLAAGVYDFSCAGHGGVVAVLGTADLPERAVDVARKHGLVGVVARAYAGGGRHRFYTGHRYGDEQLRELAAARPDAVELSEVWVGEEDCDWATVALASPDVRETYAKRLGKSADDVHRMAFESCQRWNEPFLADLDPDYEPRPDSEVRSRARRVELLDAGAYVIDGERGGAISVGREVTRLRLANKDGDARHLLVSTRAYKRLEQAYDWRAPTATADDYLAAGAVEHAADASPSDIPLAGFLALGGRVRPEDRAPQAA